MTDPKPLTLSEARAVPVIGWNIRCNYCGSYGAEWIPNGRPEWGSLAACPKHAAGYRKEMSRHMKAMDKIRKINFENYERIPCEPAIRKTR